MRFRPAMQNLFASGDNKLGVWPALYYLWAVPAICSAIALAGLSAETVTRLLVTAFLFSHLSQNDLKLLTRPE